MATMQTDKLTALLHSRKFWALISSEVGLAVATYFHGMPVDQAIPLAVGALAAFMIGTAVEDSGRTPPVTTITVAPSATPPTITLTSGGTNNVAAPGLLVNSPPRD